MYKKINQGKYDDLRIIDRDYVYLCFETQKGYFCVGYLSIVLFESIGMRYEFDVNEELYRKVMSFKEFNLLHSFDPDNGWIQYHDKELTMIYERTPHRKRQDLEEILKAYNMTSNTYSKWEFLKQSNARHYLCKWRVTSDEGHIINMQDL